MHDPASFISLVDTANYSVCQTRREDKILFFCYKYSEFFFFKMVIMLTLLRHLEGTYGFLSILAPWSISFWSVFSLLIENLYGSRVIFYVLLSDLELFFFLLGKD